MSGENKEETSNYRQSRPQALLSLPEEVTVRAVPKKDLPPSHKERLKIDMSSHPTTKIPANGIYSLPLEMLEHVLQYLQVDHVGYRTLQDLRSIDVFRGAADHLLQKPAIQCLPPSVIDVILGHSYKYGFFSQVAFRRLRRVSKDFHAATNRVIAAKEWFIGHPTDAKALKMTFEHFNEFEEFKGLLEELVEGREEFDAAEVNQEVFMILEEEIWDRYHAPSPPMY